MATRLNNPFTYIVAAPTGCGKTTFVTRILHHTSSIIDPSSQKLYGVMESATSVQPDAGRDICGQFTGGIVGRFEDDKLGDH